MFFHYIQVMLRSMGLLLQISDFVVYLAGTPYLEGQVINPAIADPPMM